MGKPQRRPGDSQADGPGYADCYDQNPADPIRHICAFTSSRLFHVSWWRSPI
jgi:hypothetical protein